MTTNTKTYSTLSTARRAIRRIAELDGEQCNKFIEVEDDGFSVDFTKLERYLAKQAKAVEQAPPAAAESAQGALADWPFAEPQQQTIDAAAPEAAAEPAAPTESPAEPQAKQARKPRTEWAASTCEKPSVRARQIVADLLTEGVPITERKRFIQACVAEGINLNTADGQHYSALLKSRTAAA